MTDPRAALAEVLRWSPPEHVADRLAEAGVLLVTEERLTAAFERVAWHDSPMVSANEYARVIIAALTSASAEAEGEATE